MMAIFEFKQSRVKTCSRCSTPYKTDMLIGSLCVGCWDYLEQLQELGVQKINNVYSAVEKHVIIDTLIAYVVRKNIVHNLMLGIDSIKPYKIVFTSYAGYGIQLPTGDIALLLECTFDKTTIPLSPVTTFYGLVYFNDTTIQTNDIKSRATKELVLTQQIAPFKHVDIPNNVIPLDDYQYYQELAGDLIN